MFLERIREQLTHPLDFLDGDKSFRKINSLVDIFIDSKKQLSSLSYLVKGNVVGNSNLISAGRSDDESENKKRKGKDDGSGGDTGGYINAAKYLPPLYDFRASGRSPVVQLGYGVFKKSGGTYFAGSHLGYNGIKLEDFLFHWNKIKDQIDTPFIALCQGNENWGCLSTMFPNRTAKWGSCCSQPRHKLLEDFLNHDKTIAFIVNQHHNLSHPKVMVLPRGIPIQWVHTESLIFDSMRYAVESVKKSELLFASGSSWGPSEFPFYLRNIPFQTNSS